MLNSTHLNPNRKISSNRVFKNIKKLVTGDILLTKFLSTMSQNSYYRSEDKTFVFDVKKMDPGGLLKESFDDELLDKNFYSFFESCYWIYSNYYALKEGMFFTPDQNIYQKMLTYVVSTQFEPEHMERIDELPSGLGFQVETPSPPPKMLVEVPIAVAYTDSKFSHVPDYHSAYSVCYGAREGYPNAVVAGRTDVGLYKNLVSMTNNRYDVDPDIDNSILTSSMFMMMKDVDIETQELLEARIPDREELIQIILKYDTALGIVPFKDYTVLKTNSDGHSAVCSSPPKTKKSMAAPIADLIIEYAEQVQARAKVRNKFFPGVSICRSKFKEEIINALDAFTLEELEGFHSKVRLFCIEAAHNIFLSYILLESVFNYLSRTGWELGTLLSDGGFHEIFSNHACGTDGFNEKKYEKIYAKYAFLRKRVVIEGDIAKFDQSLLYRILAFVGMFFCMFYRMKSSLTVTMLGDMVFRLVFKYLYLVPLSALYFVKGMMFSGKYETSHGNTAYQNLVFFAYLVVVLQRNTGHEHYQMLRDIIDTELAVRSFSGDDTVLSWPEICMELFGMTPEDYREHAKKCGLVFKYLAVRPLFGIVKSKRYGSVWSTCNPVKGVTFLKNSMCFIYEDNSDGLGEILLPHKYVYRSWEDLIFRLGNSDKANSTIDGVFAKTLSISYLTLGNRQAYCYCLFFYLTLLKIYGKPHLDLEKLQKLMKGSQALYNFFSQMEGTDFPDLSYLRKRHDKQVKKQKKMVDNRLLADKSKKYIVHNMLLALNDE